jgi:hypothetical protein
MKVARGAGFKGISVRIWNEGRSAGKFIGPDYPHVKHRKCKEAVSCQPSAFRFQPSAFSRTVVLTFGGDATRTKCPRHTECPRHTSKLAGFFFFGDVAGEETFDEVGVRFPGAKFGVGQNFSVQRNCGVDAFYDEHLERA